ncbi:MAG: SpaA isopeptide-forming pilin-related protein [Aggregatilineales bacterium]
MQDLFRLTRWRTTAVVLFVVLGLLMSGMSVMAQPGRNNGGNADCPSGTVFIAKYETNDDDGSFEFDEGSDVISFSNLTNKPGEPEETTGADWESSVLVIHIIVKGKNANDYGTDIEPATMGSFDNTGLPNAGNSGNPPAISNVTFCGPETGRITVYKQVNDAQFEDLEFPFTFSDGDDVENFMLSDEGTNDVKTFEREAGTYTIAEDTSNLPEGWMFGASFCSTDPDPNPQTNSGITVPISISNSVDVQLAEGQDIYCHFGNLYTEPETFELRMIKYNDLDQDATNNEVNILPGEIPSGNGLQGWEFVVYDSNGNEVGRNTTSVENAGANGDLGIRASFPGLISGEEYTICETQQAGWVNTQPSNGVDNATYGEPCETVTLTSTTNVTRYFGNYEEAPETGTLLVEKVVEGDGDPNNPNQTFNLSIQNSNAANIGGADVLAGNVPVGRGDLAPDSYFVAESNLADGWTLTNISCISDNLTSNIGTFVEGDTSLSVELAAGDRVVCTFTNEYTPPPPSERISVILECVIDNYDGTFTAFFGYENHNDEEVEIPQGSDNFMTPNSFDVPYTTFGVPGVVDGRPGRTPFYESMEQAATDGIASIVFDGSNLVWTLTGPNGNTSTATASSGSTRCPDQPPQVGNLAVQKYIDGDRDGIYDSQNQEDSTGAGWGITVFDENEEEVDSGSTNGTGQIIFEDLPYGTYEVCEEDRDGFSPYGGELCQEVTIPQVQIPLVFLNQPDVSYPVDTCVVAGDSNGWTSYSVAPGEYAYVEGVDTPPLGTGSYQMKTGSSVGGRVLFAGNHLDGIPLADINGISFQTYIENAPNSVFVAPSLNLYVDLDGDGIWNFGDGQSSNLVYEPYYNGTVVTGTWQTWTITQDSGKWWDTRSIVAPGGGGTIAGNVTFAEILANYPNAKVVVPYPSADANFSGFQLVVGSSSGTGWLDFIGYIDNVAFNVSGTDLTCDTNDFEPELGTIAVQKYIDGDRDGIYDSQNQEDSTGAGWGITVFDENEQEVDSGSTNGTGQIIFEDLPYGTYEVCEEDRDGFSPYGGELCQEVTIPQVQIPLVFLNQPDTPPQDLCEMNPDSILVNGCFEEPEVNGNNWEIFDDVTGWDIAWLNGEPCTTNINPSLEIQTEATLGNVDVINGEQYAELDSDCEGPHGDSNPERTTVEISQTLTTIPGHRYEVSFYFNARPNHISQNLRVTIDGVDYFSEAPPSGWELRTFEFVATSTETVIAFADTGDPNSYGVLLDCINVIDLGAEPRGSVRVTKFNDLNTDGDRDNGEDRLPGWTFELYEGNAPVGDPIRTRTTNASGRRNFGNLLPGTYTVCEVMQTGWTNTTPLCQTVEVVSGEQAQLSFGNIELPPVTDTCGAIEVIAFNQGLDRDFDPIVGARSNANMALGAPQNNDTINFVSLGFGDVVDDEVVGELILRLDGLVVDDNGSDFDLYFVETSFGDPSDASYPESVEVFISLLPNGPWTSVGSVTQDGGVDFPGDGASALYVRLVDTSNRGSFSSSVADGYDLDGILCDEPNIPPVAEDDYKFVWYGQDVCINVLANDFDGDGDMLSIVSNTSASEGTAVIDNVNFVQDYMCYDHDNDNSPAPGGTESDEFDYTVTDGEDTDSATVSIDIARLDLECQTISETEITWQVTNPASSVSFLWDLNTGADSGADTATAGVSTFVTPRENGVNEVAILVGGNTGFSEQDRATDEGCEEESVDVTLVKTLDWNGNEVNNAVSFELCIDDLCGIANSANGYEVVIPNVPLGSYTLSETPAANWTVSFPGGTTANVTADNNTFTIHNTADAPPPPPPPVEQVGTIVVTKNVITPPAEHGDFTICISNAVFPEDQQNQPACYNVHNNGDQVWWNVVIPQDQDSVNVVISENPPGANWTVVGSGASVTVNPNLTTYHTITNTYNAPPPPSCEGGMGPQSHLSGVITISGLTAYGTVYNNSNVEDCQYQIGMASYSKYDEIIDNQIIFQGFDTVVTIPAGGSVEISIALPECAVQVDLFYGSFLPNLNGQRYGSRLLAAIHLGGNNYCEAPQQEQPPVEDEQPPVEDEQPPVEDEQPPVEDEQPPVEDEQPPVEDEQPPVEDEQPPAEDE